MSAFGFDPEQIFARRRSRPTDRPAARTAPPARSILISVVVAIIVLLIVIRWLLGLRADYLYYKSVGHTNVFWTPLVAHIVLFLIGFAIVAVLVGVSAIGWSMSAANLDRRGRRIVLWTGGIDRGARGCDRRVDAVRGVAGHPRVDALGARSARPTPSSTWTSRSSSSRCPRSTTSWACCGAG